MESLDMKEHIAKAWAFYRSLGSPKYIAAPMVEHSECAFRMLNRKYGTQVCYTPMLHSKMMVENKRYKELNFWTSKEDRPLVAQFCGNDPDIVAEACKMVQDEVDAVDLNLGCPQGIARKGHYGSFLLKETDLICAIIRKMHDEVKVPVTVKIRVFDDVEETLHLVKRIQEAGAYILTVHGRTKEQNKETMGSCNWDIIKKIKEVLDIPVFANGGVYTFSDVERCLQYTGCDGVMSSEALLENPSLFQNKLECLDKLALEYIDFSNKYNPNSKYIKPHLFKILYQGFKENTDLRDKFGPAHDIQEIREIVEELKIRRQNMKNEDKLGWYKRHWLRDHIAHKEFVRAQYLDEQTDQISKKICLKNE